VFVGRRVKCLFVVVVVVVAVVVIRFLMWNLKWLILGLNFVKIDSSVPEFPRTDKQT
jgi:hypothetical protein